MKRELSIYLDLLRTLAALVVFLGHLSWARISGGELWWMQVHGHTAVIVFFVLSGFVIQHVITLKEQDFYTYSLARFARLYSVVLPALLLTLLCDSIGRQVAPEIYIAERETYPLLRFIINLTFVSQSWGWNLEALSNAAFWSLPYEFWYYQIFGAICLLRGKLRLAWVAVSALVAGPAILVYLPIWLMGALACRASHKQALNEKHAWSMFALTLLLLVEVVWLEGNDVIQRYTAAYLPPSFSLFDFAIGALLALNLWAAAALKLPLLKIGKPIAFLASFSFALYLFHLPLLHFAAAFLPPNWSTEIRALSLAGFTLAAVYGLGLLTEHRKQDFARSLAVLWQRLGIKPKP